MPFIGYVAFKGTKQGQIKGESTKASRKDKWTEILVFQMGPRSLWIPKAVSRRERGSTRQYYERDPAIGGISIRETGRRRAGTGLSNHQTHERHHFQGRSLHWPAPTRLHSREEIRDRDGAI
jgi:hypothetical protein